MSQIQTVKAATDIVEVIGSRVDLQRAGSNLKGLCPFHSEKSPSFFVSETMQRFRCFGCGETGDVFEFLQKYEGMTFYEALESLAEAAGITLEKQHVRSKDDERREQLLAVLNMAKEYYHYLLLNHTVGSAARTYLSDRGVSQESIKVFQLGAAPPSWDGLLTYLHKKKKYPLALLEEAGLILKGRTGRYYDRFRNRLIFPLKNHRGQVVGFSGRLLDSEAKEAKYINSPETALYHKSEMLFGYHELYQAIRQAKRAVVVEGEFDVISSAQAHVNEVVAIKGSALTEEHVRLLKRAVTQVLLALDTDDAGVTATKRAIKLLKQHDVELRVIRVPGGKDPDELARKDPKAWREAVKQSVTAYEFLIAAALQQHDEQTPEGKRRIMQELSPVLAQLQHAVEREYYTKEIAKLLSVSVESVREDIARVRTQEKAQALIPVQQRGQLPEKDASPSKRVQLERFALFLLTHSEDQLQSRAERLSHLTLETPGAQQAIELLSTQSSPDAKQAMRALPEDLQELLFAIYTDQKLTSMLESIDAAAEWRRVYADLAQQTILDQKANITAELATLDEKLEKSAADEARQDELLRELVRLNAQVRIESTQ